MGIIKIYNLMSVSKWIGASLGWTVGGPIGAIVGLALASIIDGVSGNVAKSPYSSDKRETRGGTSSGDFELSLLVLASVVIKADNHQDQRELDFVRKQFSKMYGKNRANHAFRLFKNINKQEISTRQVCLQIRQMMDHPSRLQLLHFLFGIAKADNVIVESEINEIHKISQYLGISKKDFDSIKAMFHSGHENPYRVLEISKSASVTDIKSAYRKMAKKYHPDRVIHLGEEHQKGAEEKFRRVQEAYELIKAEKRF